MIPAKRSGFLGVGNLVTPSVPLGHASVHGVRGYPELTDLIALLSVV